MNVLIVGSVPLSSAEEVFSVCGPALGDTVASLPDGETGDRMSWVVFQAYRVFHEHPQLETVHRPAPRDGEEQWTPGPGGLDDLWDFRIKDGVEEIAFGNLRYADVAIESYEIFTRLRDEGRIADGVRFQVCLPMPESAVSWFFRDPGHLARVIGPYEEALGREIDKLVERIPPSDLAIQWDTCWEVLDMEGIFPWALSTDPMERWMDTMQRISPRVPEEALLGYHLCYADIGHRHIKEPEDLALCVSMANTASARSGRRVDWFHMPVPRDRDDDAYFEPLERLDIAGARVFLGLLHHTDGEEGARRRAEVASRHLADFGVATECGFGRRPPEHVPDLLELHRAMAAVG